MSTRSRTLGGALALAALVASGCSAKTQYQGDQVIGSYGFQATLVSDDCHVTVSDGGAGFGFSGVFSYSSASQQLFLDTDGNTDDDHVGTLVGRHFSVQNSAFRDLGCGDEIRVVETIEGDLFQQLDGIGGCDTLLADGGLPDGGAVPDAGFVKNNAADPANIPTSVCGVIGDVAPAAPPPADGGPACGGCQIVYRLSGTLQTGGSP
jgi:hypothetical protein